MTRIIYRGIVAFATTILCTLPGAGGLGAQNSRSGDAGDTLWSRIEAQLERQPPDSSVQFILTLVRGHCGQDLDCLRRNYYNIMIRLEQQFNLPAAIDVCKEMVQVARMQKT
ncbi:MAG: hypothetical protein IPM98_15510 [Lewinellaceae bacterium]|nr:hypothetical protein [Lewinellaceae bacterium]